MPLRIAIVTQAYHPTVGGVTQHVEGTAASLRARGHQVTIVTSRHPGTNGAEPGVFRLGRNFTLLYNGADNNITLGLGLEGALREHFERGAYDVVHVHCPLSPSLPMLAIRSARQPVVGTFHSVSDSHAAFRIFRPILLPYFERLAHVIAVSEAARDDVLRTFTRPISVVPNGVDLARFRPGVVPVARYRDGRVNILFVGRFDPRKGLPELLEACERLAERGTDFRLILVGDGRLRPGLERRARRSLPGRVVFEGQVPHERLPQYYATADLFCSPARGAESFGLVLLEAMALGVPVVASDIPGYRCVVSHGTEGLLTPPRNPAALADALGGLIEDPERRARMGAAGVRTAARFGWDRVARDLERIYASVLGARGEAPERAAAEAPETPAAV
ncbi:MAG TPA: glycosyltransferase family 4 protein [Candidatus Eisenbacteria bacterium]|nr:glycosyltransferase family 4 protein [Candidatus Eisenbacteria bacterium]